MTMSWIDAGRRRRRRSRPCVAGPAARSVVLAELLVVGLRPPPHHGRQRMTRRRGCPSGRSRPLVELDRDDLAVARRAAPPSLPSRSRSTSSPDSTGRARARRGRVLGGDQAMERRDAAGPAGRSRRTGRASTVVRLAGVQVVARGVAGAATRHRLDEVAHPEHLLVEVVDLAVLDLEVAPDRAAQPARLGPAGGLGLLDGAGEGERLVGRQRPLAHLGVRAGRQVDPPDRPVAVEPAGRRDGRQPVAVRLEGGEEFVDPAGRPQQCSNVFGQPPNFSPSSPIVPTRSPASVAWSRR